MKVGKIGGEGEKSEVSDGKGEEEGAGGGKEENNSILLVALVPNGSDNGTIFPQKSYSILAFIYLFIYYKSSCNITQV